MNTSIGLGNGYALDAVRTAFVLQALICSLAFDDEGNIFDTPLSRLIDIQDFDFPTFTLRVACVHAKEFSSEKRCLVSTCSGLMVKMAFLSSMISLGRSNIFTSLSR